jgi:hypothetical protein
MRAAIASQFVLPNPNIQDKIAWAISLQATLHA